MGMFFVGLNFNTLKLIYCYHDNVSFCSTAIVGGKFELVTEVSIVQ